MRVPKQLFMRMPGQLFAKLTTPRIVGILANMAALLGAARATTVIWMAKKWPTPSFQ
jgi:hypothetical protein